MGKSPTDYRRLASWRTCTLGSAAASAVVVVFGAAIAAQQPSQPPSGLGRPPTAAELRAWDLSIAPDGAELPSGSGTVAQGEIVFTQRGCAGCHGPTAIEGPGPVLVGATP